MTLGTTDIWSLVLDRSQVDPDDLAAALDEVIRHPSLDFRTQLLVRDSIDALQVYRGSAWVRNWLSEPKRQGLERIWRSDLGDAGFQTLEKRLMDKTRPTTIEQFLRELGAALQQKSRITVGGSVSLIMTNLLERRTDDVDVVDEVPSDIRSRHDLLDQLATSYGLRLTHFQSHYLPDGWQSRLHSLGVFGRLEVYLVDAYDVFLSKLFSARRKDRDDLRMLLPQLDRTLLDRRLLDSTSAFRADVRMRAAAEENWYILTGQILPTA